MKGRCAGSCRTYGFGGNANEILFGKQEGKIYYIDKPVCVLIRETWIAELKV